MILNRWLTDEEYARQRKVESVSQRLEDAFMTTDGI